MKNKQTNIRSHNISGKSALRSPFLSRIRAGVCVYVRVVCVCCGKQKANNDLSITIIHQLDARKGHKNH